MNYARAANATNTNYVLPVRRQTPPRPADLAEQRVHHPNPLIPVVPGSRGSRLPTADAPPGQRVETNRSTKAVYQTQAVQNQTDAQFQPPDPARKASVFTCNPGNIRTAPYDASTCNAI